MLKIINTHTGKIFVDTEHRLEFLTVGDYGKENNIKADFLGLHKEIHGVQHHAVDLTKKWVATISTQKGCCMRCQFCDCPKYGYYGDCSEDELAYEVRTILEHFKDVKHTERFNVHFARTGEPTFNPAVLTFAEQSLRQLVGMYLEAETVHPVVSTMMPAANKWLKVFLREWCAIKNWAYQGEAGLQLSIQSTDEEQRTRQFSGMSLSLPKIAAIAEVLPEPNGRKYTLNFAVTKDTILNAKELDLLFDKQKFIVKITPIHQTAQAVANGFDVGDTYEDYDVYKQFEEPLLEQGWDVIVFVPSKEEDADRITCGNALIAEEK
jgi:23S rRNA (adenine2503-C2)-methyltransferase